LRKKKEETKKKNLPFWRGVEGGVLFASLFAIGKL